MGTENRGFDQNLSDLIMHIQNGMECIRDDVARGSITEEMGQFLLRHQQDELDFLSKLPPEFTFRQVMENHFKLIRDRSGDE
jgi:hypothetical protein